MHKMSTKNGPQYPAQEGAKNPREPQRGLLRRGPSLEYRDFLQAGKWLAHKESTKCTDFSAWPKCDTKSGGNDTALEIVIEANMNRRTGERTEVGEKDVLARCIESCSGSRVRRETGAAVSFRVSDSLSHRRGGELVSGELAGPTIFSSDLSELLSSPNGQWVGNKLNLVCKNLNATQSVTNRVKNCLLYTSPSPRDRG